jgi:POTRA domain, FtsQ-type
MKTRRTAVNRRATGRSPVQHHLLELKVRTESVRRQRRRRAIGLFSKLAAGVLVLLIVTLGARIVLARFFFGNPEYALRHLDAHLDGVMTTDELVSLTGFQEGKNIFLLDLDQANRNLAALPEVRSASIERILPDTVRVDLERRDPIFLLTAEGDPGEAFLPGKSLLCDAGGVTMKPDRLDSRYLKLPVLKGLDLSAAVPGKPLESDRLASALALQRALSGLTTHPLGIRSVDISKSYAAVVTDDTGARFTFGNDDLPGQVSRLEKLLAHCGETGRRLETANLMVSRNTPVTFVLTPEPSSPRIMPVGTAKKSASR